MIVRLIRTFIRAEQPEATAFLYMDEDYDHPPQQGMTLMTSNGEEFAVVSLKQYPHLGGPGWKSPTLWAFAGLVADDTYGANMNFFLSKGWLPLNA
jgi:hypothetical protein